MNVQRDGAVRAWAHDESVHGKAQRLHNQKTPYRAEDRLPIGAAAPSVNQLAYAARKQRLLAHLPVLSAHPDGTFHAETTILPQRGADATDQAVGAWAKEEFSARA